MVLESAVITTVILLVLFAFLLHKYVSRNYNYWKQRQVAFPQPMPFFGNFFDFVVMKYSIGDFLGNLYKNGTDPVLGYFIFGTPHLLVRSPEILKDILIKDFNNFTHRSVLSSDHDRITSYVLFSIRNPDWKLLRTKLTQFFRTIQLKYLLNSIIPVTNNLNIYIKENVNNIIDAQELSATYLLDVLTIIGFSFHVNSFKNQNNKIRKICGMLGFHWTRLFQQTSILFFPWAAKIFRFKFFDPKATNMFIKLYEDSVAERRKNTFTNNDFLETLNKVEHDEQFCKQINNYKEKIRAQAFQLFAAGLETTSGVLAYSLYELCLNPKIQIKLQMEISNSKEKNANEINYETINEMNYLNMVVLECLRKYPVFPYLDRIAKNDYHVSGSNLVIEKDTPVFISLLGMHYDPEYFPEPNEFIPERFESDIKRPFVYMPFGQGPRNCIGQRLGLLIIKMGLVKILSEFNIKPAPKTPSSIVFESRSVILTSNVGLPIIFEKRTI